jgi:membrane-bound metal-dependent hydrolase YbcI (DUF457 family)
LTPVGHAAVALVVGRPGRRLDARALVIGGVLPDVDWVLFWAPGFNAWHRVATHSLLFVAIAAPVIAWLWRRLGTAAFRPTLAAIAIGALAHLLVDACMDTNPTNGVGVAILWPFQSTPWSPFNVMRFEDNPAGWDAPMDAAVGVLRGLAWELPFVLAAALLWLRRPARPGPRDHAT